MYKLGSLKFLVIDSQAAMHGITRGALDAFGIRDIMLLTDAGEALAAIETFNPDVVIVDHILRPMDGVDFTMAARQQQATLDNFIPLVFTSALSPKERVYAARDAGISEFLARPFSADGLYKRLYQAIENPRPFVHTDTYIGPDRRRRDIVPAQERRGRRGLILPEQEEKKDPRDVRIIQPNDDLKKKVGSGGLSPNIIRAAQVRMNDACDNILFQPVAMESLDWGSKTLAGFVSGALGTEKTLLELTDSWSLLKANAAALGYPLIADIAKSVLDFLEAVKTLNEDTVKIVKSHETSITVALQKEIHDRSHPLGHAILTELAKVNQRYYAKYMPPVNA